MQEWFNSCRDFCYAEGMARFLTTAERTSLLAQHRRERDGRVKDRIKVVLLYDDGWSFASIAEALFLSDEGVRQQLNDYIGSAGKKLKPENGGSEPLLSEAHTRELIAHLTSYLYVKASDICGYVHETYGIRYSVRGMTEWLKRNDFTFHQPSRVPAKANSEMQQQHIDDYEKLKRNLPEDDHILWIDGVHPTHAVRFVRGWIRKGQRKEIPTNGSQKRMNIMGALDLEKMALYAREYPSITGENIVAFLAYLLTVMPLGVIHIILDQAGYHTCQTVKDWLIQNQRIKLHYLPPYSPNLNAIEPCWKIMHEHTTNNAYYPSFKQFTEKIWGFINHTFPQKAQSWTDRLTDNFRIMGSSKPA